MDTEITANAAIRAFQASNLRNLRDARGMTQGALADQLGVDVAMLEAFEQGRTPIPVDLLKALSDALEVPIAAFHAGLASYSRAAVEMVVDDDEVALLAAYRSLPSRAAQTALLNAAHQAVRDAEETRED